MKFIIKHFVFLLPLLATPVFADETLNIANIDTQFRPLLNLRPSGYVSTAINLFLGIAGVASFIFLLWGGLQWVMSGSDKEALEKARKKIMNALIGLIIVFSAYALLFILRALFNIDLIQFTIRNIGSVS